MVDTLLLIQYIGQNVFNYSIGIAALVYAVKKIRCVEPVTVINNYNTTSEEMQRFVVKPDKQDGDIHN